MPKEITKLNLNQISEKQEEIEKKSLSSISGHKTSERNYFTYNPHPNKRD